MSINVNDAALRSARTRGLRGRHSVEEGLRLLLRGSGYTFRLADGSVVQLVKVTPPRTKPQQRASTGRPKAAPVLPPASIPSPPIVVTASKRNARLTDFPGSVHVATLSPAESLRLGSRGSEILLRQIPNLTSTDLGSGRNKIFIRGIADSSFNGQNQSTVSQYLDESRLIYSAPDPALALYDIERIEVIEGPQGTLYGAGSLGGVIRLVPSEPSLAQASIAGTVGLTTSEGERGHDAALVANAPLGSSAALRMVAYDVARPGYIDDPSRDLEDINRTTIRGLRATLRLEPLEGWTADLGVVGQNLASRDGQYTNSGRSDLVRRSTIAQPFDNDYRLAFATVRRNFGTVELTSNTSYTNHAIDTAFDATRPSDTGPRAYFEDTKISLVTHETRLSGRGRLFSSWVLGGSIAHNIDHVRREIGDPDALVTLSNVRSGTTDAAIFGEGTLDVTRALALTAGARISFYRQVSELTNTSPSVDLEPKRSAWRLLPTAALSWKPGRDWLVYARYHEGYRPGSQRIVGEGTQVRTARFSPDELKTTEGGVRFGNEPDTRFSGGVAYAYSRWQDVQADLITTVGFPYVANIGSGYVRYTSAYLSWKPAKGLELGATGFLATSHLDRLTPAFATADERDLPNIADSGWRVSGHYEAAIGTTGLKFDASVSHIGKSYLAIGAPLERRQGDFYDASLGCRISFGKWGVSVDVDNLLDSRANRFSFGNPFSVADEDQRTPLRPRTLRIGVDAQF
ncbi:TonB-dependent receptor [Tsuneonella sp. YG55]|uniref:TonB-dependent receptor n=1 Tax=Tsuneonella litorea TaxID=2976475 RepID=A0A9X3A961_9SPHN|nr:TonB-dependent receptor [Tsuneonella litorea]MCT2560191.1 TonB-dependent receptor [Tsuneonella litorea]